MRIHPMKWLHVASLLFFTLVMTGGTSYRVEEQSGKVVKIIDGDTFDMLTPENKTVRIRMNGIDCPERKQDYYQVAKDGLGNMIFQKNVELQVTGRDRNKRLIAIVFCNKQNINLAMIRQGYAWHFKKYSSDSSFARAELEARKKKLGLWKMDNPIPPWEFRNKK